MDRGYLINSLIQMQVSRIMAEVDAAARVLQIRNSKFLTARVQRLVMRLSLGMRPGAVRLNFAAKYNSGVL